MIGTMRGLGLLKNTTTIVFIALYIVAPPFEYLFGFTLGFKIPGLWSGMFIGSLVIVCSIAYIVYIKKDWDQVAREAHERMQKERAMIDKVKGETGNEMQNLLS